MSVGQMHSKSIVLRNKTNIELQYKLDVLNNPSNIVMIQAIDVANRIPPSSQRLINFSIISEVQSDINCQIKCITVSKKEIISEQSIEIIGKVILPHCMFDDIRFLNTSIYDSREQFGIDKINKELQSGLTPFENQLSTTLLKKGVEAGFMLKNLKLFSCDFGEKLVGKESTICFLNLTNISPFEIKWRMDFAPDLDKPPERFIHIHPSKREIEEEHILDNKIFEIIPKNGTLSVDEAKTIKIIYKHSEINKHSIKVLFKIEKGKRFILNLVGSTIHPTNYLPKIVMNNTSVQFIDQPIGLKSYPIQYVRLRNDSKSKMSYNIKHNASEINKNNHNYSIFNIPNHTQIMLPERSHFIPIIFQPLEQKSHRLNIIIITEAGGNSLEIEVCANGFNPEKSLKTKNCQNIQ
eukprot:UN33185